MKKTLFILAAVLLVGCAKTNKEMGKEMNQLSFTNEQAAWMTAIACHEAKGDLMALESATLAVVCLYGFPEEPECFGCAAARYR